MTIGIRSATPADEAMLYEIDILCLAELRQVYRPRSGVRFTRSASRPRQRIVALIDDRVVGTVRYQEEADRLHLIGLDVHPSFRRRGVARSLVSHIEEVARTLGKQYLSLHTVREIGNVPIFRRLGFEPVQEEIDQHFETPEGYPVTDVYMQKTVTLRDGDI